MFSFHLERKTSFTLVQGLWACTTEAQGSHCTKSGRVGWNHGEIKRGRGKPKMTWLKELGRI